MIMRSDCRGEPRKTSAPKRALSNRDAAVDIISMAQQAKPKVIGHSELLRAQFSANSLWPQQLAVADDLRLGLLRHRDDVDCGVSELLRAQFSALSSVVVRMLSPAPL